MWLALILALVVWSHPAPIIFVCMPGHGITVNCEQLHYSVLGKWRFK